MELLAIFIGLLLSVFSYYLMNLTFIPLRLQRRLQVIGASLGRSPATYYPEPIPIGYKCAWLAIRTENTKAVLKALQLEEIKKTDWTSGIESAYRGRVFVGPPINGWTLVVSIALPIVDQTNQTDHCLPFLQRLGERFEDVQYFATQCQAKHHAWVRVVNGEIRRAYAWLGNSSITLWNSGEQTPEEIEQGWRFFDEREAGDEHYWLRTDREYPEEKHVMALAGAWSLNPLELEDEDVGGRSGYLGHLPIR